MFDKNFFSRYLDRSKLRQHALVFEMQLLLHPTFKNLDANLGVIVRHCYCKRDQRTYAGIRMAEHVRDEVIKKARSIMLALAADEPMAVPLAVQQLAYSEELVDMVGAVAETVLPDDFGEGQVDEDLQRWRSESSALAKAEAGTPEIVLDFWRRQADVGNYKYLSKLVRVLFVLSTSSAQIERDFGMSGNIVTSLRSNLTSHNVEMASFLCANRSFIQRIAENDVAAHMPTHILVGLLEDDDVNEMDSGILDCFSGVLDDSDGEA